MGQQGTDIANGASLLVIDQTCDNDQLLISLSKNGAQWLSPVGWTDQQKVTLLDCRPNGDTTEIDIPAEFAKDIQSGDVLVLRCSELDIEKEFIWEASEIETRKAADIAPAATGLASGLLSRFKSSKVGTPDITKSEAELRVDDASRAAEGYKAKMEAATAAKEQAQRKALDAAREAEAALKMEAERITEMERAAKAFEEAERLKQDEMRRVDEERRAEEARLAEEARRIEDARKREIAAQKAAERKAALERYEAALDITRDEELRLKERLKGLHAQAKVNAENTAVQTEDLDSRRGHLVTTEESAANRSDSFEKNASKLDDVNAELLSVQTESDTLNADRQALSIRLTQADADYQQAQQEAEAAIARAEARRADLDIIRSEDTELSSRMSSVSEKLSSQSLVATEASEKTQKLKLKSETAQAELAQAKLEIEALEQSLRAQSESDQNLRLETEATQQAIEDSQVRELSHCDAIDHLEAGGDPAEIADIDFKPRSYTTKDVSHGESHEAENIFGASGVAETGLFNRVRRSFSREKDAEISIGVEDVVLEVADVEVDPILLAGIDDTPSFVRRHGSSLMALGAVIGGIAILGGGYAVNKSAAPRLEVKSSTPAPTQVASAVTKVELPKAFDIKEVSEVKPDLKLVEAAPVKIELPQPELAIAPTVETAKPKMEAAIKEAVIPAEMIEPPVVVKMAEVVDPTGFAFDLPDMMPVASPKKAKVKPAVKKAVVEKAAPKPASVKTAALTTVETKPELEVVEVVNYPELTSDIQTRLSNLGFYTGDINGVQTSATKEAITNFKTLFEMADTDDKITGALLTELKQAEREQDAAKLLQAAQAEAEAQAAVQVAEATPVLEFYDTVQAVPTATVVTDSLPAASAVISASDPTPAYVAPEPKPVMVASIPAVTEPAPTPVAQDVVIEAKVLKNAGAKYPGAAQRRGYFVNVAIVVAYDIDAAGRASNIRIESNDHTGRYNDAFEKEAMSAIKKLRFEPKTVNGVAVMTTGRQKRIVFRTE